MRFVSRTGGFLSCLMMALGLSVGSPIQAGEWKVAMGEVVVTPQLGYPMAGYYHERLATGTKDPLKARCLYLSEGSSEVALIGCDLTGVSWDLVNLVREKSSRLSGIPADRILLFATHSHTAPDYNRELHSLGLSGTDPGRARTPWIGGFIDKVAALVAQTKEKRMEASLHVGEANQGEPVSFNRRFVMKDGSVKTWQNFSNKEVLRSAGPIDPQFQILGVKSMESGKFLGAFTSFALHLDTVGGLEWSADYPRFLEQSVREIMGQEATHVFGLGCCGDINHVNPFGKPVNKTPVIGESLGKTLKSAWDQAKPTAPGRLVALTQVTPLPIKSVDPESVTRAASMLQGIQKGVKVDFLDQVDAYRTVMLDHVQRNTSTVDASQLLGWGLTHRWKGVGESLPVEVKVVACGPDLAFVFLPGEVFVDLGLQIKRGSPFTQTFVIELSNGVETAYIPTRGAYAQGGYEVINSMVKPGSGEILVETSLSLLRRALAQTK